MDEKKKEEKIHRKPEAVKQNSVSEKISHLVVRSCGLRRRLDTTGHVINDLKEGSMETAKLKCGKKKLKDRNPHSHGAGV